MDTVRAWQILRGQTALPPTPLAGKWTLYVDEATGRLMIEADDGSSAPVGVGSGGGMANPMTAVADLIVGGTAGAPTRLGVGGPGQVLTVVGGLLAWAAPSGGGGGPPSGAAGGDLTGSYPNPQIAPGVITDADVAAANKDGTAGVPSLRTLGVAATAAAAGNHAHAAAAPAAHATTHQPGGSDALAVDAAAGVGSLRTIGAGPVQAAAGSHAHAGMITNPMTATQDIIVGGAAGTPTRMARGVDSAVLTVVGGVLTWVVPAAPGMTNPMTTPSDLILGGVAGAPTRLAVGPADGQVLSAAAGVASWQAPPATLNLMTNPGVDVWQRGPGPFTLHNSYTADGWGMQLGGTTTMSVTRVTTPVDAGSQYAAQLVVASWSANANFWQRVENFAGLRGVVITYAVRVRSTVANAVRPWVSADGATAVFGAFHSGGGAYETLTVTITVPTNSPGLSCGMDLLANGTYQVDNATLVVGSVPAAYRPLHTADELARCQRYYWEIGGIDPSEFVEMGQNTSTTGGILVLRYAVEMIATPTVTVSAPGDWQVFSAAGAQLPCTALTAGLITKRSCRLAYTVASGLVAGDAAMMRANTTLAARLRFDAPVPP